MGNKVYILYHSDKDGQGAAFAAWKKFGDLATYIPVNYGQPMPEMDDGSEVYIVDFSYKAKDIIALTHRMKKVVVIDHHKTAKEELDGVNTWLLQSERERCEINFDMNHAGCVLAWEYFHPNETVPTLLEFIEDRDLWRFKRTPTKAVHAFLCSYSFDFQLWDEWIQGEQKVLNQIVAEGEAILRANNKAIKNICREYNFTTLDGHVVPCVNTSFMHSESAQELKDMFPDAPFVCVYWDIKVPDVNKARIMLEKKRVFSLRSSGSFDVSVIAKKFGGGGHKNAAGFTVPII